MATKLEKAVTRVSNEVIRDTGKFRPLAMQFELNIADIKASLLFAATGDIRYYLNSIYIETGPNGARVVGCDGHTLSVIKVDGKFEPASIIVPREVLEKLKIGKRNFPIVQFDFAPGDLVSDSLREIRITTAGTTTIVKEIDGKFPDFRRVIPEKASGEFAVFNPEYLVRVQKACTLLGEENGYVVAHNGSNAGFARIERAVFVVMPVRSETPPVSSPEWIQAPLTNPV